MKKRFYTLCLTPDKVESFLKDAGYIVEKLQTIAVDMSRIFTPDVEEDLWKKYVYIKEAYTYLLRVAPTLLTRSKNDIVDGMFVIIEYHNKIQSKLAYWKDMIKYYNEHGQPVVLAKHNPDLY